MFLSESYIIIYVLLWDQHRRISPAFPASPPQCPSPPLLFTPSYSAPTRPPHPLPTYPVVCLLLCRRGRALIRLPAWPCHVQRHLGQGRCLLNIDVTPWTLRRPTVENERAERTIQTCGFFIPSGPIICHLPLAAALKFELEPSRVGRNQAFRHGSWGKVCLQMWTEWFWWVTQDTSFILWYVVPPVI